ncbi:MAG: imidazoleglycerol-phosphate dehydratase [Candidatus Omnitrophota bacterium]|nr:MAG: imidazoleglycerol-phosphate dehydratase [Candidatus Omnitrophota bacterium]
MRKTELKRRTNEVDITGSFNIDGAGKAKITTELEPLNHLLTLFAFHGLFDLELNAQGDLQHHIVEDVGIAMGKAFKEALGEKQGISRYGNFTVAMDKVAVEVALDISGRPSLHREISTIEEAKVSQVLQEETFDDTNFNFRHAEEFLEAFLQHAGISLIYIVKAGDGDLHHLLEALFKAFGKALDQATQIDPRRKGVPSTKGIID